MPSLDELVRDAVATAQGRGTPIAGGGAASSAAEAEVARVLQICNACRYCEGFCAVFPAMTRRLEFPKADIHFLASLCHNCGACLHACQYAAPHEFAVNVPQAMARVRVQTYADGAWPTSVGALYRRNGLMLSLALAATLTLFVALVLMTTGSLWPAPPPVDFYHVFPHQRLVAMFAPVFGFAVVALAIGLRRFWRARAPGAASAPAVAEAAHDVLRLKYLGGGHGEGCNNADDAFTLARRRFHHLTFYGFMLCFAATCVGTLYHYAFGWSAPYGITTWPKLLGVSGGLSLTVGTVGLWRLNRQRDPRQGDQAQKPMDLGFIALLFLTATTGLALAASHGTRAMALLLAFHLGAVMALFVTLPYGKFVHGIYRSAALLQWAIEKRRPSTLALGDD